MKRPARLLVVLLAAPIAAFSLSLPELWVDVGGSASGGGITWSPTAARSPALAVDFRGRPTIAWLEGQSGSSSSIHLRTWDGSAWLGLLGSDVGEGLSPGMSEDADPAVAVDRNGFPIVAWVGNNVGWSDIFVKRWNGADWEEMDSSGSGDGISGNSGRAHGPRIAMDPDDRPVVCWGDDARVGTTGHKEIYLRRWDGEHWIELNGSATGGGISNTPYPGISTRPALALDASGAPVVAWRETIDFVGHIWMRRWTGAAWEEVGASTSGIGLSLSEGESDLPAIACDASGNPCVAWHETLNAVPQICLKRWTGSAWEGLGGSDAPGGVNLSDGSAAEPALRLDATGAPIVAWQELVGESYEILLRRWDGAAWTGIAGSDAMGGLSASPLNASSHPCLVLDPDGLPVVAWSEDPQDLEGYSVQVYLKRAAFAAEPEPTPTVEDDGPGSGTQRGFCSAPAGMSAGPAILALLALGVRRGSR